ncbi:MAG: MBL fold metallo-hydrolase [Bacteroidetes bacterium]|nr:MAG: MBL fold metallo-hydrolase [Bacteroidota bacterium]
MLILFSVIAIIILGTYLFLHTERFGKHPSGERLERIKKSPNYTNGAFQNLETTPMLTEGVGYGKVFYEFLVDSKPKEPKKNLPSKKTDLKNIKPEENVLIWMGHSSYYFQLNGKRFLVDPVFSGYASPVSFTTNAFPGTDIYSTDEFPEIDFLILTHDHWDHMDYQTLKKLKPKIKHIITGLGNGAHLEHWGFRPDIISEGDWYDSFSFDDNLSVHVTPARHFSGRGFKRNQTLWASFVVKTGNYSLFIGGDSGYGNHFKTIGDKFGPFDLVILENGQYNEKWKYIHMLPGEQLKAVNDLQARSLLPVHSGKFTLANHDWDEPFEKITSYAQKTDVRIITPMIGEKVNLKDATQQFSHWWKNI